MGTGLSFRYSPQFVRLGDKMSDIILTKTGVPQGTVLTPFLLSLYSTDYRHTRTSCCIQMFSDDTALVGLINQGVKGHPLHCIYSGLKSSFRGRLVMPRCYTEWFRRYFIPAAVRFCLYCVMLVNAFPFTGINNVFLIFKVCLFVTY